jgi:hypothetical protein
MKQWLAIIAAVIFLTLPIMVSAGEETDIPPEANWSPEPPTPAHLVVSPERTASSTSKQGQVSDSPRPFSAQLSDEDAKYQAVNDTIQDD